MKLFLNRTPLNQGKYFDLIQKDWENGLILFIEEVLSGFSKNYKIQLNFDINLR